MQIQYELTVTTSFFQSTNSDWTLYVWSGPQTGPVQII
uniref:Uncharacterized protein n=1 Tax=Anguilla anguilla TaxID=7936 RepID=A0A0E9W1F2_ANGAN